MSGDSKTDRRLFIGGSTTFAYDGYGKRIKKGSTVYTYDGSGKVIKQSDGTNTLEFIYDTSGLSGIKHSGTNYIIRKNIQGDITHLLDTSGNVVVRYVYDAWGNHTVTDASGMVITSATHIGTLNPFRYRSYLYDPETNLYFLQTRYYDPETGRFISQDDVSYLDPDAINGLNLYAYCGNNPVMGYDPNGTFDLSAFFGWLVTGLVLAGLTAATILTFGAAAPITGLAATLIVGATIGAYAGAIGSIISQGGFSNANPWQVLFNTVTGAATGMLMASPLGAIATGFAIGGIGFVQNIGNDLFDTKGDWSKLDIGEMFLNALIVGVASGVVSGIGKHFVLIGRGIVSSVSKFTQNCFPATTVVTGFGSFVAKASSIIAAGVRTLLKTIINGIFTW